MGAKETKFITFAFQPQRTGAAVPPIITTAESMAQAIRSCNMILVDFWQHKKLSGTPGEDPEFTNMALCCERADGSMMWLMLDTDPTIRQLATMSRPGSAHIPAAPVSAKVLKGHFFVLSGRYSTSDIDQNAGGLEEMKPMIEALTGHRGTIRTEDIIALCDILGGAAIRKADLPFIQRSALKDVKVHLLTQREDSAGLRTHVDVSDGQVTADTVSMRAFVHTYIQGENMYTSGDIESFKELYDDRLRTLRYTTIESSGSRRLFEPSVRATFVGARELQHFRQQLDTIKMRMRTSSAEDQKPSPSAQRSSASAPRTVQGKQKIQKEASRAELGVEQVHLETLSAATLAELGNAHIDAGKTFLRLSRMVMSSAP